MNDPDPLPTGAVPRESLAGRLARLLRPAAVASITPKDAAPVAIRLRLSSFETARVRDVMIPRTEISAVEEDTSLEDLVRIFAEQAHSRMPIYRGTLDEPVGLVHIKDVMAELVRTGMSNEAKASRPLPRLKRDLLFVPESMRLPDLLLQMQAERTHMAIVVDEYGGTDGLVCLEDLIEQVVGDIEDEHDEDETLIRPLEDGALDIDSRAEVEHLEQALGVALALEEFEDEFDSVGGLVSALAGRLPVKGEVFAHPAGVTFEVADADARRLIRLIVRRAPVEVAASEPLAETAGQALDRPAG